MAGVSGVGGGVGTGLCVNVGSGDMDASFPVKIVITYDNKFLIIYHLGKRRRSSSDISDIRFKDIGISFTQLKKIFIKYL